MTAPRFAALFPGQLSEKAGMGESLAEEYPYVSELFETISRRSGVDIAATFFGDGAPTMHDDLPAQVGIFAVSLAALDVLDREFGLVPRAAAGYSLGTYASFVAAGSSRQNTFSAPRLPLPIAPTACRPARGAV